MCKVKDTLFLFVGVFIYYCAKCDNCAYLIFLSILGINLGVYYHHQLSCGRSTSTVSFLNPDVLNLDQFKENLHIMTFQLNPGQLTGEEISQQLKKLHELSEAYSAEWTRLIHEEKTMERNQREFEDLNHSKVIFRTKKYGYDQNYDVGFSFALNINHIPFNDLRQACCDVTELIEDEPYYSSSYTSKDEHGNGTFILKLDPAIIGPNDINIANIRKKFIGMFKLKDRKYFIVELEEGGKKIIRLA